MRVGVIGSGFGARVVAPAFAAIDGVEVVDVVSARDADAVQALVARTDVDLISIQSPPFLHLTHVRMAVERGHAVLCDKPVGVSAAEATAALAAAEGGGVAHFLNVEFRCDPIRIALHESIVDGVIGRVEQIRWTHRTAGSTEPMRRYGWLFDGSRGGGFIGAWAPHAIDFVRWSLGEVEAATARRRIDVIERVDRHGVPHRCTAEDGFVAELRMVDGAEVHLDASFACPDSNPPAIVVQGSDGVLIDQGDRRLILERGADRRDVAVATAGADRHVEPMRRYGAQIIAALRFPEGAELPSLRDGVAIAQVLDSLRAGPLEGERAT